METADSLQNETDDDEQASVVAVDGAADENDTVDEYRDEDDVSKDVDAMGWQC